MEGAISDLRTGLSQQMVEIHEPLRILFVIDTFPEKLLAIFKRNPVIQRMVFNQWVQVATSIHTHPRSSFSRMASLFPMFHREPNWTKSTNRSSGIEDFEATLALRRSMQEIQNIQGFSFMLNFMQYIAIASPLLLVAILAVTMLFGKSLSESVVASLCKGSIFLGLLSMIAILVTMLVTGERRFEFHLADFVILHLPDGHHGFHFDFRFVFDRLSVPMAILSYLLCGTIGAFGVVYLHREKGFHRFFLFFSIFLVGMIFASLSYTIETLFLGWELVGLSSALLVAYFHERPSPVRNGLRVWGVYRVADAAFLIAAIFLHNLTGEGNFKVLMGDGEWPMGVASSLTEVQALTVGLLLMIAAAGNRP